MYTMVQVGIFDFTTHSVEMGLGGLRLALFQAGAVWPDLPQCSSGHSAWVVSYHERNPWCSVEAR